jgi:uncharacterized protein (DUF2132 family)
MVSKYFNGEFLNSQVQKGSADMEHKICIARIRRSGRKLALKDGAVVNCTTLARLCDMDRRVLSHVINETMPELRDELRIVRSRGTDWKRDEVFRTYRRAARKVREDGDLPCHRFLAAKLNWRLKRVQRYLAKHPKLASQLDLYSDDEALMWRSARAILARDERVTRLGLADEMDRSYVTVMRILRARPKWVGELCIVRAKRGSGVRNRLYPHKKSL